MKDFRKYLQNQGYKISTTTGYVSGAGLFLKWCKGKKINPNEVTYTQVLNYLESVRQTTQNDRTISSKIQAVRMYYNYLIKESAIDVNPVKDLQVRNKVKRVPKNNIKYEQLVEMYQNTQGEGIVGKRNRIMLGLMIYQGLNTGELAKVEVKDINIHEGTVYVPQVGRSNSRTLKLEAHQVIEIQNYIKQYRPMLLAIRKKKSDKLIVSTGPGKQLNNTTVALLKEIRKVQPSIKRISHIRACVINHWLKKYNTRQVQYMAGHRYVSSTEPYSTKKIESLQEQLEKLMPQV